MKVKGINIYFIFRVEILCYNQVYEYDKEPPLSYYEDNYVINENDLEFLEEYVRYSLKYNLGLSQVYYDYYARINGYNCLKIKCVTESLAYSLPSAEFLDNYEKDLIRLVDIIEKKTNFYQ